MLSPQLLGIGEKLLALKEAQGKIHDKSLLPKDGVRFAIQTATIIKTAPASRKNRENWAIFVDYNTAVAVIAAFGDVSRFKDADHAASYPVKLAEIERGTINYLHTQSKNTRHAVTIKKMKKDIMTDARAALFSCHALCSSIAARSPFSTETDDPAFRHPFADHAVLFQTDAAPLTHHVCRKSVQSP